MLEKDYNRNEFKFVLTQGDVLLGSKVFTGDVFNSLTRQFIDIRSILPEIIGGFQRILSRRHYTVQYNGYDLLGWNKNSWKYNPSSVKYEIDGKVIKGVECKIGLYINENPIVERTFYVDRYNPVARHSVEIINELVYHTNSIEKLIKKRDVENTWDDYDLVVKRGMTYKQIRDLSSGGRAHMIRNLWR